MVRSHLNDAQHKNFKIEARLFLCYFSEGRAIRFNSRPRSLKFVEILGETSLQIVVQ